MPIHLKLLVANLCNDTMFALLIRNGWFSQCVFYNDALSSLQRLKLQSFLMRCMIWNKLLPPIFGIWIVYKGRENEYAVLIENDSEREICEHLFRDLEDPCHIDKVRLDIVYYYRY